MKTMIAVGLLVIGLIHVLFIPNAKINDEISSTGGAIVLLVCLIEFMGAWIIFTI